MMRDQQDHWQLAPAFAGMGACLVSARDWIQFFVANFLGEA